MNVSLLMCALTVAQPLAEPPVVGRPIDWSGAIGGPFVVTLTAEPNEITAEEPLTLTVRIAVAPGGNAGNLRELARPALAKLQSFILFAVEDVDDHFIDDPPRREFRYRMRPRSTDVKEIPRLKFVYFNPRLRADRGYMTTYSEAVPLTVKGRMLAEAAKAIDDMPGWVFERPTPDEIRGRQLGSFARWLSSVLSAVGIQLGAAPAVVRSESPWLMIVTALFLPPATCAGWLLWWRRRNPTATRLAQVRGSRSAAVALRKLRACSEESARDVAAALVSYLQDRMGMAAADTTPTDVSRALTVRAPGTLVTQTVSLLKGCDEARFAPAESVQADLRTAAEVLILEWEALPLLPHS